ncbi:MAG TPA: two-component regulator propeller domain-containing protein, partial [Bacteroidota bacterium]|nr:two-component regulator propeller domain-containing protein [Bacteroidota bacterium]
MRCAWLNIFMFIPISISHAGAAASLFRSDVKFERVSVDQGLSNITVSCITQDMHGFLWIGTEDGLNRYDGYTFTVFRPSEKDSLSLPGSIITRVYCDRKGTLWAGVVGRGICRYDERRNGFIRYSGATNETGQPAWANVSWVFEDSEDSLWLCTNSGLWRYDVQRDSFVQLVLTSDAGRVMTGTGIRTVQLDRDGRWWVGTYSEGLFSYDPGTGLTLRYTSAQDRQFAPIEKEIIALCADRRDGIWIATLRGAYRLNIRSGKLQDFARYFSQPVHLTNGIVLDVREDSRGDVWIGTFHGGLFRYIPAADTFFNYRHDPDDPRSIVSNRIEHMYEDLTGSLWFASYRDGLNKYTPVTDAFFRFKEATPRRPGINGQAVYAIAQDSLGRLLFGTNEQGLTVCDPSTGRYSSYPAEDAPRYGTMAICIDREGNVWASEGATLKKHDRRTRRFVNVPLRTKDRLALNAEVKCLRQDHAGFIWVGMNEGGLFRVDPRTGASEHFQHSESDSTSLPWPAVWCVFEDSKKRLWVGTFGGGLGLFNRASQTFVRYQQREGDT